MTLMVRAAGAELTPEDPQPGHVLAGNPVTSSLMLTSDDKVRHGIWQITPGTAVAVAPAGMFVVLSGRATIAVNGGPTFDIGPGDVCIWDGGERTIWTVHETLRKVYQITRRRDFARREASAGRPQGEPAACPGEAPASIPER